MSDFDDKFFREAGAVDAMAKKNMPEGICLSPVCPGGIACPQAPIDSHTVSRRGSLSAIARNNHVYSLDFTQQSHDRSGNRVVPRLVGWRDASTYPLFCGMHDGKIFSPLEGEPFVGSKEQCFLLAYRSVVRELYVKKIQVSHIDLYKKMLSIARQSLAKLAPNVPKEGISEFLRNVSNLKNIEGRIASYSISQKNVAALKAAYDDTLVAEDWDKLKGVIIEIDGMFPIQCSGAFRPQEDIFGEYLPNPSAPIEMEAISLVSFAADGKSYILLLWLSNLKNIGSEYVKSIRNFKPFIPPQVIATVILQNVENHHCSPDWYDSLPPDSREWYSNNVNGVLRLPPVLCGSVKGFNGISVRSITDIA